MDLQSGSSNLEVNITLSSKAVARMFYVAACSMWQLVLCGNSQHVLCGSFSAIALDIHFMILHT